MNEGKLKNVSLTLEQRLARFDPVEAMASAPLGQEAGKNQLCALSPA
ncbi:MAG: hypothetical protein HYS23_12095 [Geobacter sp.]|nr:hypothetical protein [Geobacter sp.]